MRRLTTLLFAISLVVASCGSSFSALKPTGSVIENRYFSSETKDYVYRCAISVYGHDLSGILYIKKTASATHRLVLTTEFGNTLLDATLTGGKISVNSIVEELDRKILINTLEKDFSVLLRDKYEVFGPMDGSALTNVSVIENERFEITEGSSGVSEIIRSKRKPKATYTFLSENDTFAHEITIEHFDLKLKMKLKALEK